MRLPTSVPKPKRKKKLSVFDSMVKRARAQVKTPIKKVNHERQARKEISYRAGMARYRKSETFKAVEQRAGGRCECHVDCRSEFSLRNVSTVRFPVGQGWIRCPNTRADGIRLEHHHVTYLRFGGNELPEDMVLACTPHHRLIEVQMGRRRR